MPDTRAFVILSVVVAVLVAAFAVLLSLLLLAEAAAWVGGLLKDWATGT